MKSDIRIGENMPNVVLPPRVRGIVYMCLGVVGLVLGAISTAYGALNTPFPGWLVAALAVGQFLTLACGVTAASHTSLDKNGDSM